MCNLRWLYVTISIRRLNVRVSLQFIALRSLGIVNSAYLYGKYWKICTDSEKYWKKNSPLRGDRQIRVVRESDNQMRMP